jgi:hypothetical protein
MGATIAFTTGFEMTLAMTHLKIVFGDCLRRDGRVVQTPDVDLLLTAGKTYRHKETKYFYLPLRSEDHEGNRSGALVAPA